MARRSTTVRVIYAAMAGNCLVAITKFIAAAWTGGSAMTAEGVHSLVDTGNQALLLYGLRQAEQRPTPERPLGHGREVYFWSFIVALLIFSLGAGVAMLEGILHILNPRPLEDAYVNYVVLALPSYLRARLGRSLFARWRRQRATKPMWRHFDEARIHPHSWCCSKTVPH
jgi:divalent metal cation (Fe/Co/Zn/Cd) transporter